MKAQTEKASLLAYIEAMDEEKDRHMLQQLAAILYRYFEKKEPQKQKKRPARRQPCKAQTKHYIFKITRKPLKVKGEYYEN